MYARSLRMSGKAQTNHSTFVDFGPALSQ
jgi:hypothetical protein